MRKITLNQASIALHLVSFLLIAFLFWENKKSEDFWLKTHQNNFRLIVDINENGKRADSNLSDLRSDLTTIAQAVVAQDDKNKLIASALEDLSSGQSKIERSQNAMASDLDQQDIRRRYKELDEMFSKRKVK